MKQRKRGNQSSTNGKDHGDLAADSPVASSSANSFHSGLSSAVNTSAATTTTASTQRLYSSSSSISTTSSSINSSLADPVPTAKSAKSGSSLRHGAKPMHSQTMLLELLLTVPRASLIIITPLVAGMILRVAPSMMEPIYGSIFIEDYFLEYSLVSVGVGVVLAMIYTFLLGSHRQSLSPRPSSSTNNSGTADHVNDDERESIAAGLRKDARLRKGIIICLDICALFLASSFFTTHTMFKHSGDFGPWRGPHLTQLFLAYPVLASLGFANTLACVLRSYERVHVRTWMSCVLIQIGSILGLTLVVFQMAPLGQNCPRVYTSAILVAVISGLHKMLTFTHGEVALPDERLESRRKPKTAASRASLVMSFIPLVLVLAMAAQNATRNPQCQGGVTKAHNPVSGNYTILARNESVTGWISVVDEHIRRHDLHIRVMRAGHSLIGGMYAENGDSIFGTFYIPEGVLVDVVEIDPVVADYASMYFDWPKPHQLFIQDGRQYIKNGPEGKYDYVIHDVFTGGGVPPSLFSLEALHEIQRIMKPDGVLSMNMVGSEHPDKSQALNSVRRTLHAAFEHVVGFKESPEDQDAYQNMVFFASQKPIEFEKYVAPQYPTDEELEQLREGNGYLPHALRPSVMRDWVLDSFEQWPLSTPYDASKGELILDRNNTLNAMQRVGAEEHWQAMRTLLPLDFWVNY
ncbi:hypothetical protein BGZ99_001588 [Dissophora globulifera]|uniref:PABS domain-containing protein n=1 Tax=Dissophora globulifera TaxID=979702 RepID=A0A9P6RRC1_9FUNG|nr:hypothetical protein BGZ99_001588 [Dissophora globulifera]